MNTELIPQEVARPAMRSILKADRHPEACVRRDRELDPIAHAAARLLGCPTGAVVRVFAAAFPPSALVARREMPLAATTFANAVILGGQREIVCDASKDARFARLLEVIVFPKARFMAGFPLIDRAGATLGALTVVDYAPRREPAANIVREVERLAGQLALALEGASLSNA